MTQMHWEVNNQSKGVKLHPHASLRVWKRQPDWLVQQSLQSPMVDDTVSSHDFPKHHMEVQLSLKQETGELFRVMAGLISSI